MTILTCNALYRSLAAAGMAPHIVRAHVDGKLIRGTEPSPLPPGLFWAEWRSTELPKKAPRTTGWK